MTILVEHVSPTKIHYFFCTNVCTIYKLQIFNRKGYKNITAYAP